MKTNGFLPLLASLSLAVAARGAFQMPDTLLHQGQTWEIAVFPLDDWEPLRTGALSLWWTPNTVFAANLRGYVASWEIADGRLWLTGIKGCQGAFMGDYQPATLASLFPEQTDRTRIPADWFSGRIFYPSFRYGMHLLPLDEARREAQSQWTIAVERGRVTAIITNAPQSLLPTGARHPESIDYYSSHETYDLLARPEVRTELDLTAEQLTKLDEADAFARAQPIRHGNDRGFPAPEVTAFLTPHQNKRLQELMLQVHGPAIFFAYSQHPSLADIKKAAPEAVKQSASARGRVRNRYLDLCNAYRHLLHLSPDELELLADAVEDVVTECDAAALDALPPEWRQEIRRRMGKPLFIHWPRHTQRQPFFRETHARAKAEAHQNADCDTPEIPVGFETIGPDAFRLASEDVIFRRISPRRCGDPARDFFMMETEMPNRVYALYLADTRQQKGDADLRDMLHQREQEADRSWSSLDTPYTLQNTNLLWNGNEPPDGRENFPVALISHTNAMDFCHWLNRRYSGPGFFWLPTREQWCLAAYGGNQRACPWGDVWDPDIPHLSSSRDALEREPVPVDSKTRDITPDGIRHLGGNVQEYLAAMNPGEDFTVMDTSWAGSSFRSAPSDDCSPTTPRRTYWGYHHGAASRQEDMGFRVVWIPTGCHALPLD